MFDINKLIADSYSVLSSYKRHHDCVFATKVFIEVAHKLNIGKLTPLTVSPGILKNEEIESFKKHGTIKNARFPNKGEIGKSTNDEKWCGHLVAILKDCNPNGNNPNALFDLTISQINNDLKPKAFSVNNNFVTHGELAGILNNNIYIAYKSYPSVTSFTSSIEWNDPLAEILSEKIINKFQRNQ